MKKGNVYIKHGLNSNNSGKEKARGKHIHPAMGHLNLSYKASLPESKAQLLYRDTLHFQNKMNEGLWMLKLHLASELVLEVNTHN